MDKRKIIQALFAFTSNSYIKGFFNGRIYRGKMKKLCLPGLNCYSCPGALGACPIGAMQAVEGSTRYGVSMYVLGFLAFIGIVAGRFICGWLCPFGLLQEVLHKIPGKKIKVADKVNAVLKWGKYAVFLIFVIFLPIYTTNQLGISVPGFCKYICPAGTLEGGIPLVLLNKPLQSAIGFLFTWKMAILIIVIVAAVLIFRPFCRYICPLGAFYSVFNPISLYHYEVDASKCIHCGKCASVCKMCVNICKEINSPECIRCGDCIKNCPTKAIYGSWGSKINKKNGEVE